MLADWSIDECPCCPTMGQSWAELRKQLTAFVIVREASVGILHLASPNLAQLLHVSLFSTRHLAHPTLLTVIAVRWCHEALPHSLAYCTTRSGSQQDNAGGRRLWHTASASDQTRRGNRLGPGNAAGHWSAARMGQSTQWPLRHSQTHARGPNAGVKSHLPFRILHSSTPKHSPLKGHI